ncbi:uncharacterized protein LOC131844580 [Achroia grisella]|uniref:uncharacterized protein LOC131844580 n=1 Tax=Achroia grisella TaxID=688607 RepID=UPI0027D1F283|nr:uncharacterized protein LOC131844580 [Achroia grisella]
MDESLGYNENERILVTSQWQMGVTSALSFETEGSTMCLQTQKNNLQLIQKKKIQSERPTIPATQSQRLAYYRCHATSPSKTQIICMQHVQFNRFLWYYIFNLFFKSVPHTYVYIFLASYAEEEHFFLPKMVPICCGLNIAYIIAAILEIFCYVDNAIFLLDYAICGIFFKNPWNRCDVKSNYIESLNISVNCYELEEFSKKFVNGTSVFYSIFYVTADTEYFQLAPIEYFKRRITFVDGWNYSYINFYFIFMWLLVALHYKALFKKYVWVHLNRVQLALNIMYVSVFVHLVLTYFMEHLDKHIEVTSPVDELTNKLWKADVDMLAESMTTPPVVHILTARSDGEIQPSRDSSMILASNAIYFIFRGLLSITSLAEVIGIYILYPLGRLLDDITFHHGVAPNKLRILNLRFVPIFYTIKIYTLMDALLQVLNQTRYFKLHPELKWSFLIILVPIFLGIIYAIVKFYIGVNDGSSIFRPKSSFGPRDFTIRQWRKQYDSREYVGSEACKLLSRYMISQAESKAYKLDVMYNTSRYSTPDAGFRTEKEKK